MDQEVLDWLAYDQGDAAQGMRAALWRPMQELVQYLTSPEVTRFCESFNHRHLMRRKVRRMVQHGTD